MCIWQNPVLNFVDSATKIRAAGFLTDQSTCSVCATFVESWGSVYTRLPNKICVHRGFRFGDDFHSRTVGARIDICRSSIDAHLSLGNEALSSSGNGERFIRHSEISFVKLSYQ